MASRTGTGIKQAFWTYGAICVPAGNMIRILHLIETLGPGGAEHLLHTTIKHLNPDRFQSVVVALSPPLDLRKDLERVGVPVHCLNMRGHFDWRRGVLALNRLLRSYRIQMIHTHLFYANFYGRIASLFASVPVVVSSLHNADYSNENKRSFGFILRKLADILTARLINSLFIAVSEAVREDYRRHFGLKNIEVLYNWIDIEELVAQDREASGQVKSEFGFAIGDFVLINVAKLRQEQKGQQYLIQAMCEIKAVIPQARLLLVGDGPDRAALQELSRSLGLEGFVVFAGKRRDIAQLLAMADIFVFPSVYEGFGIALVEAMAMGKSVIASRVEGILEIVTHEISGLLIEPHSSKEIANAAIRLYRDSPLKARLEERAKKTAFERFSAKTGISRLEGIYTSLADDALFALD